MPLERHKRQKRGHTKRGEEAEGRTGPRTQQTKTAQNAKDEDEDVDNSVGGGRATPQTHFPAIFPFFPLQRAKGKKKELMTRPYRIYLDFALSERKRQEKQQSARQQSHPVSMASSSAGYFHTEKSAIIFHL